MAVYCFIGGRRMVAGALENYLRLVRCLACRMTNLYEISEIINLKSEYIGESIY